MSSTIIKKIFCPIVFACLMAPLPLIGSPSLASAANPGMEKAASKGTYDVLCHELKTGTVICAIKGNEVNMTCTVSKDVAVLACTRDIKKSEIKRTFRLEIPDTTK